MKELLKLATAHEGVKADLANLDKTEPDLKAEILKHHTELANKVSHDTLVLLDADNPALDADTRYSIRYLSNVQLKLSLLPGVRAKLQRKLQAIEEEIKTSRGELRDDCLNKTHDQISELLAKLNKILAPICGNDPARIKKAAEAVIKECEVKEWHRFFNVDYQEGNTVSEKVRRFCGHVARFEAGKAMSDGY